MASTQFQVDTGQRLVCALRSRLLAHIQALSLRHRGHAYGRFGIPAGGDAYCINDLVMAGFFGLFTSLITLSAMFLVLLRLDSSLALLAGSRTAAVHLPALLLEAHGRSGPARQGAGIQARSSACTILSGIKVVKSFAREPHELGRFGEAGHQTMTARLRFTWQESLFGLVVAAITLTGTALVVVVGGLHVLRGELTVGGLLVVIAYWRPYTDPCHRSPTQLERFRARSPARVEVREVLALVPEALDDPGAIDGSTIKGDVRFDHVSFGYDDARRILDDVSFAARPGEMVALVGLTGAGKSTLVSLLPRFYEPTAGRILVDGVDVSKYGLRSLRDRIAIVLQDAVLFGGTVADNLRYGRLDATDAELQDAARTANAHDFIMRLPRGYDTPIAEAGRAFLEESDSV